MAPNPSPTMTAIHVFQSAEPSFWEQLGWVDRTALAVLGVFLVLGLFRGLGWQLGRIAMLTVAYVAALLLGPFAAGPIGAALGGAEDAALPLYLAGAGTFLASLVLLVVLARLVRSRQDPELAARPSALSRLGGGVLGVVSGALVALALLTGVALVPATTSFGGSVARAAESSETGRLGRAVVDATRRALPAELRLGADAWDDLLRGTDAPAGSDGLGTSSGDPDGAVDVPTPGAGVAPVQKQLGERPEDSLQQRLDDGRADGTRPVAPPATGGGGGGR